MYRGKKTAAAGKPATTAHDGMPGRSSSYRGRKTAAAGPPEASTAHVGFPDGVSGYRGTKKAAADVTAATPHVGLPGPLKAQVGADKRQTSAAPASSARPQSRHRMAGSHDGMYVTEHHRGAKG